MGTYKATIIMMITAKTMEDARKVAFSVVRKGQTKTSGAKLERLRPA